MSRTNVHFIVCLTLSCLTAAAVPASAQHFQQITGTPLSQIAAGRKEVWGLYNSRIYRFNPGSGGFDQIQGSLSQIAVGGGTLLQSDEVWGLDSGGSAYRFNFSTKTFTLQSGPGVLQLSQIAVGAGYEDNCHPYEIWGINSTYIYRYNYCISQFENIEISFIDTYIPEGGMFTQIAVSGAGDVWGLYPGSSAPAVLEFTGGPWGDRATPTG